MKSKLRKVRIMKDALLSMLFAAIETFPKECLGTIFGKRPTRKKKYHLITNAIPIQLVTCRKNNEVEQDDYGKKQLRSIIAKAPKLYPALGSFHSYPEGRKKIKTEFDIAEMSEISKADKKSMRKDKEEIAIIITVSYKKKLLEKWHSNRVETEGWIEGRLGRYNLYITAHAACQKKNKKKKKIKQICISAPEAIRALNREWKRIEEDKEKK